MPVFSRTPVRASSTTATPACTPHPSSSSAAGNRTRCRISPRVRESARTPATGPGAGRLGPTGTRSSTSAARLYFAWGRPSVRIGETPTNRSTNAGSSVPSWSPRPKPRSSSTWCSIPTTSPTLGTRADSDCPVGGVSWYEVVRYCNRLSQKAGLEPFFPDEVKPGTMLPKGGRDRGGFRLPTEAEWEYICRAETETCRPFGQSEQFLDRHVWTLLNSRELLSPAGRLLPNQFGLFDTLGSQWEWCLDGPSGIDIYPAYPIGSKKSPALDTFRDVPVNDSDWRSCAAGASADPPRLLHDRRTETSSTHLMRAPTSVSASYAPSRRNRSRTSESSIPRILTRNILPS